MIIGTVLISRESCSISFRNDGDSKSHYGFFHQVMNYLETIGYTVTKDPDIEKNYKILSKDHRYGINGKLEFKSERYPHGFNINFFQNVVFENQCGGEYDSQKIKLMPYLIKLVMYKTMNNLERWFNDKGIVVVVDKKHKYAEDFIKNDFVKSFHHPQKDMNFNLSYLDGSTYEEYNSRDRDKKIIKDGDIKYFRSYDGRLRRGRVYHNINNMWWVILNKYEVANQADFELFDATEDDYKERRKKAKMLPKEYVEKRKSIESMTNKELIRELKRRGIVLG